MVYDRKSAQRSAGIQCNDTMEWVGREYRECSRLLEFQHCLAEIDRCL
jgi:hypothetical protein